MGAATWRAGRQDCGDEPSIAACAEALAASGRPEGRAEARGIGGSLLSSISGAVKSATKAVKTAMLEEVDRGGGELLRRW